MTSVIKRLLKNVQEFFILEYNIKHNLSIFIKENKSINLEKNYNKYVRKIGMIIFSVVIYMGHVGYLEIFCDHVVYSN